MIFLNLWYRLSPITPPPAMRLVPLPRRGRTSCFRCLAVATGSFSNIRQAEESFTSLRPTSSLCTLRSALDLVLAALTSQSPVRGALISFMLQFAFPFYSRYNQTNDVERNRIFIKKVKQSC